MRGDLGVPNAKARFRQMFSNRRAVNVLAGARIFLFAGRDVWFVVGVPVYLRTELGWTFWQVGAFLAVWVIGYGIVLATAPRFIRGRDGDPDGRTATWLAFALAAFPAAIALALTSGVDPSAVLVGGLIAFGVIFAANSAVHSFLILADGDRVAMNVGFYYMANAGGRLAGTCSPARCTSGRASRPACGPPSPARSRPARSRGCCRPGCPAPPARASPRCPGRRSASAERLASAYWIWS